MKNYLYRWGIILLVVGMALPVVAGEPEEVVDLREPIYRVTKQESRARDTALAPARKSHPLDAALKMARAALAKSQANVNDYTAIFVKRERISGKLGEEQYMLTKIRNEKRNGDQIEQPFSVYLKFLRPGSIKGREVIYVRGSNNDKLIAHEGGWKGKFTPSLYLDPHGSLAMLGQRYPITDMGIENLCLKLIERGLRDRRLGMCQVTSQPAKINNRNATRIEVIHPVLKPSLDFHVARIFVDDEYGYPVRYEAYDWPRAADGKLTLDDLIEEITYVRLKFNSGLTDLDFDPANPKYNME